MMYPDSMDKAAMFLKLLAMMSGTVASMGQPAERESPARFLIPFWNLLTSAEGSMLTTSSGRMAPSSQTPMIFIPQEKGLRLSFLRRAASEALTFFPLVQTLKSLVISIWPLLILVEMLRAWKKLICEGSRPVDPFGTVKSTGETTPTRASVGSLLASILVLSSKMGASEKMRAILSLRMGTRASSPLILPPNSSSRYLNSSSSIPSVRILMIFLVRVFLLMTRWESYDRRSLRICWIWLEPTLVKLARMICLWFPNISQSLLIVAAFYARLSLILNIKYQQLNNCLNVIGFKFQIKSSHKIIIMKDKSYIFMNQFISSKIFNIGKLFRILKGLHDFQSVFYVF